MDHDTAIRTHAAERYALNELTGEDRDAFEEHYFSCGNCADDVRELAIFVEGAKAVLRNPLPPWPLKVAGAASEKPGRSWFGWLHMPTAAAAALAGVFAILFGVEITKNQRLSQPQLGPAAVLHGETRGDVPAFEAGKPINLLIALEEPVHSPVVTAELRSQSGELMKTVTANAPQAESGLSLLLPDPQLQPGRYSVIVGSTKYPFEVRY